MKNSVTLDKKKENKLKRDMLRVAEILIGSSKVVELRALNVPSGNGFTRTWSGYFDNALALAKEAFRLDQLQPQYVSVTINSVNSALLARCANKTKAVNRGDASTSDSDITRRCWLVIDLDPVRPSGISSTDMEKEAALAKAYTVIDELSIEGWAEPMLADSGNGYHILYRIDLDNSLENKNLCENVLKALAQRFDNEAVKVDTSLANASRIVKFYGTMARKGDSTADRPHRASSLIYVPEEVNFVSKECLEQVESLVKMKKTSEKIIFNSNASSLEERARSYLAKCDPAISGSHGDVATFRIACNLINDFGLDEDTALPLFMEWNSRCNPPWDERSLINKLKAASKYAKKPAGNLAESNSNNFNRPAKKKPEAIAKLPESSELSESEEKEEDSRPLRDIYNRAMATDLGNAERLIRSAQGSIKYVEGHGWYAWNGKLWTASEATVKQYYRAGVIKAIYDELHEAEQENDIALTKELLRWAKASESSKGQASCLSMASSMKDIAMPYEMIDSNPFLFCCDNATIDLKTGEGREHKREDFITRYSNVVYNPKADCPIWHSFLERIFNKDLHLIEYIQMAVGYCMTGSTKEQCLFILHGSGANGKSVFMNVVNALLGSYCMETPVETFMKSRFDDTRPSNDVARLAGARVASANETERSQALAESKVKAMTGDDLITARFLNKEFFTFRPQFKIWIRSNYKPRISGTDTGIWRRIRLIPFTVTIPEEERDPELTSKLLKELPGILNWAIVGCMAWQALGLKTPEVVANAVDDYKESQDTLSQFLAEECSLSGTYSCKLSDLYTGYGEWCDSSGEKPLTKRLFTLAMEERGFTKRRAAKGTWVWEGIKLGSEEPEKIPQYRDYTQGFLM